MIVLNTFSKAWASAGIRLGMAFASEEIIALFNKVKYPYNVNMLTQEKAREMLADMLKIDRWINEVRHERKHMIPCLMELPMVKQVYPSAANFLLVKVTDADAIYEYLVDKGIIVRNRNRVTLCQNALRITIGSKEENNELLGALRSYKR
ncbi:MAG: aminotransferase class I/II-fold pyridoxal phosphate-dependent enzyme, partial [Bacteroidaceae bacterium]|nr:aminotransferase class I/II-fold pyridoxal phosphate-dependent enzyme [Bacteroidaceae bacterium]